MVNKENIEDFEFVKDIKNSKSCKEDFEDERGSEKEMSLMADF